MRTILILAFLGGASIAAAQDGPPSNAEIQAMRKDLRSEKKQTIAANLELTDLQAQAYLQERAAIEEAAIHFRLKYIPIVRKVLPGKTTAQFFQLEWRTSLMIESQLASEIPVIGQ